ncbi:MAG: amino acid adenylation domain-containing protein, partial [Cyanobacteria bacterium P01_F01_bin.3]
MSDLTNELSNQQRHQLLVEWNETAVDYPLDRCLHQLFEAQVERTPEAIAITFEQQQLTYRALNQRANQLAQHLQTVGVGPEVLVGICLERSLEMVIGLLGILKAGGAYVPFNPDYPKKRLAFMLQDTQVSVVLTTEAAVSALPVSALPEYSEKVIYLDNSSDNGWLDIGGLEESTQLCSDALAAREDTPADSHTHSSVKPENLAYTLYTSGSTGRPKGAMNSHLGICNRLLWMQATYPLTASDRILHKTPFSFDVSIWEIFWPLITGARLVVAKPNGHKDSAYLARIIDQEKITCLHFVPSMLQVFLAEKTLNCSSLKRVICSGEALPFALKERFFKRLSATLHNLYGPTEAAIDVTFWDCQPNQTDTVVPIGRPIANTQIYILTPQMQPVPIGTEGELHIGGVGLARGYLNRPELTREKFVQNSFSPEPDARLYKTGDLARYRPDGNIEYRGRLDHQVKIRGFRIELGEIEAACCRYPNVREAVVVASEDSLNHGPNQPQLVAYVVPQANHDEETSAEHLSQWQDVLEVTYSELSAEQTPTHKSVNPSDAQPDNQPTEELGQEPTPNDPTLNIVGWKNSYTREMLPEAEMQHWVEKTVERILFYQPKRILEIGCGTGMLLFRLVPRCDRYYGIDISKQALAYVQQQVNAKNWQNKVTLASATADQFEAIKPDEIDTVIINSVLQFFPSVDYLADVLEKAAQHVAPGGCIFIGDVRNYAWIDAFYTDIHLTQAADNLPLTQLTQRIQKSIEAEKDLTVSPDFFISLKQRIPQISHVEIQLKRGQHNNELTCYRYDAILHIDKVAASEAETLWLDWQKESLSVRSVRQRLQSQQPNLLGIRNVPNKRLTRIFQCLETLATYSETPQNQKDSRQTLSGDITVSALKQNLEKQNLEKVTHHDVNPEDWYCLGDELPYTVYIHSLGDNEKHTYDVVFQRGNHSCPPAQHLREHQPVSHTSQPWATYSNNPLKSQIVGKLAPQLREYLKAQLPDYMIPASFVVLDKMPLTPNGKIDRRALPQPKNRRRELDTALIAPRSEIELAIADVWRETLQLADVGICDNFFDLGGNSLLLAQVHRSLVEHPRLNSGQHHEAEVSKIKRLSIVTLFQYPTIQSLARHLADESTDTGEHASTEETQTEENQAEDRQPERIGRNITGDIAIVGMSGRFPGAETLDEFWQNLCNGVESISFFSDDELDFIENGISHRLNYVKASGILPDSDRFDATFFGYSAREAELIDPQQRIMLECAWEAFEHAGYNPQEYSKPVGVYVGSGFNSYLLNNVHPNRGFSKHRTLLESSVDLRVRLGNAKFSLPTRIAYKLNLKGPSLNIQTACSTSLVAVHLSCKSLLSGECDMAIAGGVSIVAPQKVGYLYEEGSITSPDGHCRAFDAEAQGTVFGNGAGAVVLKRLEQAIQDGDAIHAIIKGSAVNNDGAQRIGYSAPSVDGQKAVITEALARSGVRAEDISYVEAHGTGTALGDPIEIAALTQAFKATQTFNNSAKNNLEQAQQSTLRQTSQCALGSVKTNIGHLAEAAGIAGLIKTVLALKHQKIPASLHFKQANPDINFAQTPFYVNAQLADWESNGSPRRAGVSSFGMGGTNCHIILEEAPKQALVNLQEKELIERPTHVLTLSARSEKALQALVSRYEKYLRSTLATEIATPLGDICFTASTGRNHFSVRWATVASSLPELIDKLADFTAEKVSPTSSHISSPVETPKGAVAFLFTGQGSQYIGMARQLYETQPTFRRVLTRCDEILRPYLSQPLLDVLYPQETSHSQASAQAQSLIHQTAYTQPALFAVEYSLCQLWMSWGIQPDVVMGHSIGEYVAACVAGVFSLEAGLKLVTARGKLMQALPPGSGMVSVRATESQIHQVLTTGACDESIGVSIAAINGPESIVLSGENSALSIAVEQFTAAGIKTKLLNVSHGFHSPLMEPMLADFEQVLSSVQFSLPRIKLISNVTGRPVTHEITTPQYWCRHVIQPVQFADSVHCLKQQPSVKAVIEIGPKPTLLGMARQCFAESSLDTISGLSQLWLPSLRPTKDDWQQILESLATLYQQGFSVNWAAFDQPYIRYRRPLPTYPFQRSRYWIEAPDTPSRATQSTVSSPSSAQPLQHPLLGQSLSLPGSQELRFQNDIAPHSPQWLKDHRIFERILLPGTGFIEMAIAAGAIAFKTTANLTFKNVAFENALLLSEEVTRTVQTVLTPNSSTPNASTPNASPSNSLTAKEKPTATAGYHFQIYSLNIQENSSANHPSASNWISHASGEIISNTDSVMDGMDLATLQANLPHELSPSVLYQRFQQQGMNYGPSFQCISHLWHSHDAALCQIEIDETLVSSLKDYHLHPVILDACLQGLEAIASADTLLGTTYVPIGLDRLQVTAQVRQKAKRSLSQKYWGYVKLQSGNRTEGIKADFSVWNQQGQMLCQIDGLQLKAIEQQQLSPSTQAHWHDWLYELTWKSQGLSKISTSSTNTLAEKSNPQNWLIFADEQGVGQQLARLLENQGHHCTLLFQQKNDTGQPVEQIAD